MLSVLPTMEDHPVGSIDLEYYYYNFVDDGSTLSSIVYSNRSYVITPNVREK